MNAHSQELEATARAMVAPGKGILAADESHGTIKKRFDALGIDNNETNRRDYREALFRTAGMADFVSGVILFDETIHQKAADGTLLVDLLKRDGVIPGIKVDTGAKDMAGLPGEKVTEGLDGLRERCAGYYKAGARFAKWRAVITIGNGIPSIGCIEANSHALARYAAICQENGLVPIVEPEVLMDGEHEIDTCYAATEATLRSLFRHLYEQRVVLEQTILKASMVLSGKDATRHARVTEVAEKTVRCLQSAVPAAVPGIVFLSGGQSAELATAHLNAMNAMGRNLPWKLSFSYGRALQDPALKAWAGKASNVAAAQKALYHRSHMNSLACTGNWKETLEQAA